MLSIGIVSCAQYQHSKLGSASALLARCAQYHHYNLTIVRVCMLSVEIARIDKVKYKGFPDLTNAYNGEMTKWK